MDTLEQRTLQRCEADQPSRQAEDDIAAEEPLEIRLEGKSLAVVMRTPGHDRELAAGFLLTEGVIRTRADIFDITQCRAPSDAEGGTGSVIDILLTHPEKIDFSRFTRHIFSSSSCGICGKATIAAVQQQFSPIKRAFSVPDTLIYSLPDKLAAAQISFHRTGGLHASAVFTERGDLISLREDVGRHNALDKVIGHALLHNTLPLDRHILLVSGRVSFEIMQKGLAAGIPIVAAISAPTTLAVDFAHASGQTLIGFLRGKKMNVYAGNL